MACCLEKWPYLNQDPLDENLVKINDSLFMEQGLIALLLEHFQ